MKWILSITAVLLAMLASPALARGEDNFKEVDAAKLATLRPDRAYLLLRTNGGVSPVFLRVPSAEEMAQYDAARQAAFAKAEPKLKRERDALLAQQAAAASAGQPFKKTIPPEPSIDTFDFIYEDLRNVDTVHLGKAFEKSEDSRTILVEALPGTYVFYGVGFGEIMHTCLCLGTVSVPAKAGQITDLGTILIAQAGAPSPIPELKDVTGLGPSMNGHIVTWAAALRPPNATTPRPGALAGKLVVPADYRAVGKFVSPFAFNINRLVPVPGILGYDRGDVLDLVSHSVAENHYN